MRKLVEKFKVKKIEIFLIIGFIISSYSFAMLIGYCSDSASEVIERNRFNKQYKQLDITINNLDELESINEVVDKIHGVGIENFTSKYLVTSQEPVHKDQEYSLRNEVLGVYGDFDIERHCKLEGRNFTSEELRSDEKVAIIGERVNEYSYEIDNERYVDIFGDDYKVIGVLKNTKNFDCATIIPVKSFNFINNIYDSFTFYVDEKECDKINSLYESKYCIKVTDLPRESVILYLYEREGIFRECIFQLILSLVNLILFSTFMANSLKKDMAIMKVLGCTNKDIFKEICKKNIKLTTIGSLIGIVLFKMSGNMIDIIFQSKMSENFIINIVLTGIICYLISMVISIVTLRNVIKFKLAKEIR